MKMLKSFKILHSNAWITLAAAACLFPLAVTAQIVIERPANPVIVQTKFGGQIFGFDIDQNGTEGILSEAQDLSNGNVLAAVETFDQKTGKILKVIAKTQTQDDFVTLGVVGASVGLVEYEHVVSLFNVKRFFGVADPLSGNKATSKWTPPIGSQHLINQVSRNQGTANNAVFAIDISSNFIPYVFSSNIAANTFGPIVQVTDSANFGSVPPPIAYNSVTNQAILGGGPGCFNCIPVLGIADLTNGTFTEESGFGFGFINGIAVDSADNIACTTTEDDAQVEFIDLDRHLATFVVLPNSGRLQFFSGADVEYDDLHKVFLIAQPNSSVSSGSTIYVYDIRGNLLETLNGFSFSNTFNVIPAHIALHPSARAGFVDGPSANVNQLQGFTY
jgi:hypothetical protein